MAGVMTAYLMRFGLHRVIDVPSGVSLATGLAVGLIAWRLCIPLIRNQSEGLENRNQSLRTLFQWPLIFAAALMSFGHGANDVSNAIGPVVAIVRADYGNLNDVFAPAPQWVMLIGAFGLSCGILLFGPRLIRLVGEQITKLNPMRGFCVSTSTALTVLTASHFGMPVSTTHTAIGPSSVSASSANGIRHRAESSRRLCVRALRQPIPQLTSRTKMLRRRGGAISCAGRTL